MFGESHKRYKHTRCRVNSPSALVCTVNVNSTKSNATIRPPFISRYRSIKDLRATNTSNISISYLQIEGSRAFIRACRGARETPSICHVSLIICFAIIMVQYLVYMASVHL